jgi:hypothetical protein
MSGHLPSFTPQVPKGNCRQSVMRRSIVDNATWRTDDGFRAESRTVFPEIQSNEMLRQSTGIVDKVDDGD